MNKKIKRLAVIYAVAAIVSLSAFSWVAYDRLADYRRSALYSSRQAFEETVTAVDALSAALHKSVYATDGGMCAALSAEAYAAALAAQAALSVLPFETAQLEQSSAFINTAGDYAYSLCPDSAGEGYSREQREWLTQLSATAENYAMMLRQLQSSLNNGLVIMDSRETQLQNIGLEEGSKLSGELLNYEAGYTMAELSYEGKYSAKAAAEPGTLSIEEGKSLAAKAAGVEARELKPEYEYQGADGRRCYSAGDKLICVSSRGLESMAATRLVGQGSVSADEGVALGEDFLNRMGYQGLTLARQEASGGLLALRYSKTQGDALYLDNYISLSIALDDGSIYLFNALNYNAEGGELTWSIGEDEAEKVLSPALSLMSARKVVIKSPGGEDVACYELSCTGQEGESVLIYVDALTGRQRRIQL